MFFVPLLHEELRCVTSRAFILLYAIRGLLSWRYIRSWISKRTDWEMTIDSPIESDTSQRGHPLTLCVTGDSFGTLPITPDRMESP